MKNSKFEIRNSKLILAIDTSTEALVLGIGRGEELIAGHSSIAGRKHLELSLPALEQLMKENGLEYKELTAIVVGLGPGSLIGARVGVVIAKTLAQVLKIDVIGISTLDAKDDKDSYPTPGALLKLGFDKLNKGQTSSAYNLEPIYLREPV